MLTYMLDTNICIYVMKTYPPAVREKFNALAEQLCVSSITLGELTDLDPMGTPQHRRQPPLELVHSIVYMQFHRRRSCRLQSAMQRRD